MPPGGQDRIVEASRRTSHCDTRRFSKVATVKQLTGREYQVTMTEPEFDLVKNALDQAERVSRFGMEVLDDADASRDGGPSVNSRLRLEIDALAMREASLICLQKTLAEIDRGGGLPPPRRADLGQLDYAAATRVPPPR
jgi:hypothetical protein